MFGSCVLLKLYLVPGYLTTDAHNPVSVVISFPDYENRGTEQKCECEKSSHV